MSPVKFRKPFCLRDEEAFLLPYFFGVYTVTKINIIDVLKMSNIVHIFTL